MNDFQFELPPYTHIPGKTPHPLSDPLGHSYEKHDPVQKNLEYDIRRGLFLFQNQYYWEAHEAWEQAWIVLGRQGIAADYVKGFIKLAASGVKCLEENRTGGERHLLRAKELLNGDSEKEVFQNWLPDPNTLIEAIQRKLNSFG